MAVLNTIKNNFFGICIPLGYYFGLLPNIFTKRSKSFRTFYKLYIGFMISLGIFCHWTELYKLYQIITNDNFIFDEAIRNYIITAYHFTTMIKCYFLKGKLSRKIFAKILQYEQKINASENAEIILVYNKSVAAVRKTTALYFMGIILVVITYIPAPLYRDPYIIIRGNETIEIKQMPLSSWTPFDESVNYWPAFVWTSFAGTYLSVFFVTTDLTCFSFVMFGICQIMILKHFIVNFHRYTHIMQKEHRLEKNESIKMLQRECIKMHQGIILYGSELNTRFKNIMFLDFVPSSLQIAGMIFQIMTNLSIIQCVLLAQMTCTLIARMFIYCKCAHDLAEQSTSIALAWYEIDWSEFPSDVRKNIIMCIQRSQHPIKLTIGNFQDVTLSTFLMILKGTYTYIMVLQTV
nr:odorant receptor 22 [Pachyrhinus yasumatsui]